MSMAQYGIVLYDTIPLQILQNMIHAQSLGIKRTMHALTYGTYLVMHERDLFITLLLESFASAVAISQK